MTETIRIIYIDVCKECGCIIDDTGMCSFECSFDCQISRFRPKGSRIIKKYQRTDVLISEENK